MTQLIEVPNLFKNPFGYFEARRIRRLQEASIKQNEFFKKQLALIYNANGPLFFYGYDSAFMDRGDTYKELRAHIKRNPTQISVKGIFSESSNTKALEDLADETEGIKLIKTSENITKGYIVFGVVGFSIWNSQRLTYLPKEAEQGVIYRNLYRFETKQFPTHFVRMEKQIQSGLH